jgi:hypothetical protein
VEVVTASTYYTRGWYRFRLRLRGMPALLPSTHDYVPATVETQYYYHHAESDPNHGSIKRAANSSYVVPSSSTTVEPIPGLFTETLRLDGYNHTIHAFPAPIAPYFAPDDLILCFYLTPVAKLHIADDGWHVYSLTAKPKLLLINPRISAIDAALDYAKAYFQAKTESYPHPTPLESSKPREASYALDCASQSLFSLLDFLRDAPPDLLTALNHLCYPDTFYDAAKRVASAARRTAADTTFLEHAYPIKS